MNKILKYSILLFSGMVFSQSISVDINTYSVPQLVNNVLINSPCISAQNVTWQTGTNFGSTNGIGYFQNSNPNFPMQSGVILSTGNVQQSGGPNTSVLSDGNASWIGDASLEATLAGSGITMNSTNATVLEFDFTPISSNFDFDFLFASEEYGNYQCQFSDAFAFLLTNTATGVTTNLAVVPGTNNPISVLTIRDFLYNSNCASVNSQFFGSFNGGSNATTSPTNFNGQTVVMNASTTLTPNVTYHIKLVIADRNDFQSDSAIFLSSGSFNIGQEVLGNDLTIANNSAICYGQLTTLDSQLSPLTYSFQWKQNGIILPSETGPTLSVSQAGTYELTYTNIATPCQTVTDSIVVEFLPEYITPNPKNLYKCNSGQANYTYNLSINTPIVTTGLNPIPTISYHSTLANATNNVGNLPLNYSSPGNETVYVRINNPTNQCFTIKSFLLDLVPPPTANQPADYVVCSNDANSNIATFTLSTLNNQVLNGQDSTIYNVTYYPTLADANSETNALPDSYDSTGTTIYPVIRLIDDSNCYSTTSVNLIVSPTPMVDSLQRIIVCNSYTLQPLTNGNYFTGSGGTGTPLFAGDVISQSQNLYIYNENVTPPNCSNESIFEIIIIIPQDIPDYSDVYCDSFVIPATLFGDFHTASGGGGNIIPAGTVITTNQIIYFYYVSPTDPTCIIDVPSDIQIVPSQTVPTFPNGFDCTSFTLQPLSFGNYYDAPNGLGNLIPQGTAITTSQTIYIYGQVANCSSQSSFQVVIGLNFPNDVIECANYQLPALTVGNYFTAPMGNGTQIPAGTIINTTQIIYVYAVSQSQPNCSDNYSFNVTIKLPVIPVPTSNTGCASFALPTLSIGNYYTGSGGTGTLLNAGDLITNSQTLYIFLDDNNGCTNETSFFVTIYPRPFIDSRDDIEWCQPYMLTSLTNGNYFTGPNGTGTMYNGGDTISTSQLLYIYATSNSCSAQTSFMLNINPITAQQLQNETKCDSFTLLPLIGNNKYYTQTGGDTGTGTEIPVGTSITTTQRVYVYLDSGLRSKCAVESFFDITIIPTPIVDSVSDINVCNSYTLPTLSVGNYFTQSGGNGTMLNAGDTLTTNQTLYVYAETGTSVNCFDEKTFDITIYNVDDLQDITTCQSYTLPNLTNGNYYNGPNATGGIIAQGTAITASQTIYIYGNPGYNPSCFDESDFIVTIVDKPVANAVPLSIRTVCDEDGTNDGITVYNLSQLDSFVLGTQTGSEFNVAYFANIADANSNSNPITTTTATLVFVRLNNTLAPDCFDVKPVTIIVNKLPNPNPQDGIICIDSETGQVLNPYTFQSELSASTHTFQWFDSAGIVVSTAANYQTNVAGTFSLIATHIATGCVSQEVFAVVSPSEPAVLAYTINEDFANNQVITVQATGTGGDYEYQLDQGPFQDSPIFQNVFSGIHIITVHDKNGCGTTRIEVLVINYPKYFTPNGDGIHDYWNIYDLAEQQDALINIYDRYGKLLKQIKTSGVGWDGMYNNQMINSDDYWFVVTYTKNGEDKEFKAHFSLKR